MGIRPGALCVHTLKSVSDTGTWKAHALSNRESCCNPAHVEFRGSPRWDGAVWRRTPSHGHTCALASLPMRFLSSKAAGSYRQGEEEEDDSLVDP